ncbi:50S ribosome-binding GTPase [Hokovirus HKV1]|uniref:50S ribosome-binding GTPase n=1 Tax=Hokovirus HKV1 TaxID=1977638 RepID=A0A1V0SFS5_9VIRU|nr:50S ribosome-binding GTPase [Hokovirus HKV1]
MTMTDNTVIIDDILNDNEINNNEINNNIIAINKKYILLLGVSGVGKSTLINCFIPNAAKTFEGEQQSLSRTTTDISYYDYNFENQDYVLIDTPGVFDHVLHTFDKSCMHLENILKEIEYIDHVWFCINATKDHVRNIDLEAKRVLDKFPHLLLKTSIIITKCDLLDPLSMPKFIHNYKKSKIFTNTIGTLSTYLHAFTNNQHKLLQIIKKQDNNFNSKINDKINNKINDIINNLSIDLTDCNKWFDNNNLNYQLLFNDIKTEKIRIKEYYNIENNIIIPIINNIQQHFYNNNLYTYGYYKLHNDKINKTNLLSCLFISCIVLFGIMVINIDMYLSINLILGCIISSIIICVLFPSLGVYFVNLLNYLNDKTKPNKITLITYDHYKTIDIKLKLIELNDKGNDNILIQDKIYYESGNIFYEGTLYGNTFNLGKFYNDDGTLLYHKKL